MKPDIEGLEITQGELKRLSGVSMNQVYRPPSLRKFLTEGLKTFVILSLIFISFFLLSLIFTNNYFLLILIHLIVALALLGDDAYKIWLSSKNKQLLNLFDDVDRYNAIIKAIDLNDQIEAAGNPKVTIHNRKQVIEALCLLREDLIRALKTEKILRNNKKILSSNPELFATNFTALTALQISDKASERGRLLNEALQIAVGVQEELKKLQDRQATN
ncbi:MAG: hypothetical protein ACM37W_20880 [Actinomycetota bacterium]